MGVKRIDIAPSLAAKAPLDSGIRRNDGVMKRSPSIEREPYSLLLWLCKGLHGERGQNAESGERGAAPAALGRFLGFPCAHIRNEARRNAGLSDQRDPRAVL